jgi:hypothetical protein
MHIHIVQKSSGVRITQKLPALSDFQRKTILDSHQSLRAVCSETSSSVEVVSTVAMPG